MDELQLLKRKLAREVAARKQAESILEKKALELHQANEDLTLLNENLEQKIIERTKELEWSEKRYRQIIESATDFIYRADPQGYFTYVNPVANQKLGYTEEELIGSHFTEYVPPSYREELMELYINYRENKHLSTYQELPIVSKNGDVIWIGQNVQFVTENGEIKEVSGVARDISDRKIAEDALLTTQQRLTSLITNLHSGILVENENREIVLTNRLFCRLLKIPSMPHEMIGMDCKLSAIRSKHLFKRSEKFVERVDELLKNKKAVIGEELHMADGKILERDYIPIWGNKKYLGHLWQYRDITEKYQAEEKLKRSEEKYRGIIENMELGLMEVDHDQKILKVYDWFCDMTGYTEEELIGKNAEEVFLPSEFKSDMLQQTDARGKGQTGVYEVQMRKKDNSLIWVLISGAPIIDANGNVTGSIGIHYDITDRKNLQHDLEKAKLKAEEAEKAEKQFLARMSHEIRTPLNAIIGMAHLLEDTSLSTEQQDYVDSLRSSSDILQKLISDILDLSKITAGGFEVNPKEFDLVGTVRSLQKTFKLRLEESPVNLKLEVDDRIQTMMIGDDLLLTQILLNLIGNAVKFTNNGEIFIKVDLIEKKETDCLLEFVVSDTGIGIPADRIGAVFENFKQANNEIKFQFGGTGLGLPITKQLVELQKGEIEVQSQLGKGTAFIFRLPYKDSGKIIQKNSGQEFKLNEFKVEKLNILVAEDNFMNRKYIAALFKKWNLKYKFAENGRKAVDAAIKEKFDIILMDISMPEMNGYDATIKIRNTSNINQNTPIIALTASAMISKKDKAYEVGMSDYLAKPFRPTQLSKLIQKYNISDTQKEEEPDQDDSLFANNRMLDTAHLDYLYKGDIEYAVEMFEIFMNYTMIEYEKIRTYIQNQETQKVQYLAHKLKPNFSLVGLIEIEKKMLELEKLASENKTQSAIEKLFSSIDNDVKKAKPIIEEQLNKMKILI